MTKNRSLPLRLACAVAALFVLPAVVGRGLDAAAAPTIAELQVRNNVLLSDAQISEQLGIRQGDAYDPEKLKAAVERWNETRRLGTLGYREEPTESGDVRIVLQVRERVKLSAVTFRGNKRLSTERLRELAQLRPGDAVGPHEVADVERAIESAYAQRGFPNTIVHGILLLGEEGERNLVFSVSEGQRVKVGRTVFHGNEHLPRGRLLGVMKSRQSRWLGWLFPRYLDGEKLRDDVQRIEEIYRNEGFQEVEVKAFPSYPQENKAILNIVIQEGPRYILTRVLFEGNTLFRDDELLAATSLKTQEPYSPKLVDEAVREISRLYGEQGHVDVTRRKGNLVAEPLFDPELPEVTLRFHINEREPVYIRRVEIRGLTKTKEQVVRRNLAIYPGERATTGKLQQSEQLLINTGFFDLEAQRPVEITLEPDEGALRDAVVRVKEGSTGQLMLGAGIGTDTGVLGEISVREENFDLTNWPSEWSDLWRGNALRGGGQKLSLVLRSGTERSYYSLSFHDPAAWGSAYGLGGSLYSTGVAHEEFDELRTGISLTGSKRIAKFLHRNLTIGYETIDVDDVDATAAPDFLREEGSHSRPFVRFSTSLERRDNRFMPTEGYHVGADLEVTAGDVETVSLILRGQKYWTVHETNGRHRHVLGLRGRAGVVDSYGDRVPVFERFYAGGISTLRGFEFEGVSPVDPGTEDQVGGESMLVGSLEYSLPLDPDDRVRLLGFLDAGYVAEDAADVLSGWDELRMSAGVGVRWLIPALGQVPLEVDLGFPLMRESEDETQAFHFAVGAVATF